MEETLSFDDPRPVKLTVDDFLLLADAGALDDYRRTELIEGAIVETSPMRTLHAVVVGEVFARLREAVNALGWSDRVMLGPTVKLPPHDAPEPDVVLADLSGDEYLSGDAVRLAVEVSMSTLRRDLSTKRDVYARGAIPEYWVVDVDARVIHQFWSPAEGVYREQRVVPLAGELRCATMPELAISGEGIL